MYIFPYDGRTFVINFGWQLVWRILGVAPSSGWPLLTFLWQKYMQMYELSILDSLMIEA